jgi:hypothetical protein
MPWVKLNTLLAFDEIIFISFIVYNFKFPNFTIKFIVKLCKASLMKVLWFWHCQG